MRLLNALTWRNLTAHPLRATLSTLAVAMGAAMTVAADIIGQAMLDAMTQSEDIRVISEGLMGQLDTFMTLAGVAVTVAAGFLVFNAFAMSITQRRQQIGALRSLGTTRRQVMRLVLAEALVISGAGTLLGLITGPLIGHGAIALMSSSDIYYSFGESSASWQSFALAAALGVGITLLSTLIPARRATRISPLVALRQQTASGTERGPAWPTIVGILIVVGIVATLVIAPPGEWVMPPQDIILTVTFAFAWLAALALILPALVGGVGRCARGPLTRAWGATGRLIADNLQRGRRRVMLTITTLAVGLTLVVGMAGLWTFVYDMTFGPTMEASAQQGMWGVYGFDITASMGSYADQESLVVSPEVVTAMREATAGRAEVGESYLVIVPELSVFGSSFFSVILDPRHVQRAGTSFTFTEGNWETAMPIMESGCGVLVTPLVARKNDAWLGDTLIVQSTGGPVECTIAGIGQTWLGGASIISIAAAESFGVTHPLSLEIIPSSGVDRAELEADMNAVVSRYPGAYLVESNELAESQQGMINTALSMMNGMLLVAIVAAALGVVNTTVMSVAERRRELGLLRAVGATRRQVMVVIAGEAGLMGLTGGALGMVAGAGLAVIVVMVYGGNSFGIDLDLWQAAWRSVQPALLNGLVGLIAAPFICAGAAWLPARSILRDSAIETMEAGRQPEGHRARKQITMRSINFIAWRNLEQGRTRTILSALAVALGAAMIVASSVVNSGVRNAWTGGKSSMAWVADMIDVVFTSVGVIILAAAGFLIFNAFAMVITQQRRQIGALRSLGMTRRQVMRQVLVEALVTGSLGTLIGLIAGPLFGRGILVWMKQMDLDVGSGSVSSMSVLLAVVMGLGITLLSVLIPARRATRVSPMAAIREHEPAGQQTGEAAHRRISARVGMAMLGGMAVYLIIAPPGEWSGGAPPWKWVMWLLLWGVWIM